MQEFPCQQLNRDVWSNEAVRNVIKENFVLWQVGYLFVVFFGGKVHIFEFFLKAWMFHIIKSGACCLSKIFDSLFLSLANKVTADIFIIMFFFLVNEPEKPITWDQIPFHLELILFTSWLFPLLYSCFFPLQFWQLFLLILR